MNEDNNVALWCHRSKCVLATKFVESEHMYDPDMKHVLSFIVPFWAMDRSSVVFFFWLLGFFPDYSNCKFWAQCLR